MSRIKVYFVTHREIDNMKIVLKGKDGSVAIMTLTEGADKTNAIRKFKESHDKGFYVDHIEFEGDLPLDREFRDAWTLKGSKIVVDSIKAASIHIERVRHIRNKELAKLDAEQLRHLSDAEKLKELEKKKQLLRDLPENVKGLKWPSILPKT